MHMLPFAAEQEARQALGEDGYAEIFQAGTELTVDQVMNHTIEDEGIVH